jgi:Holliday junction DNA helicase RuvA
MIAHIHGVIAEKTPTRIVLDVQGVGYDLMIPVTTFKKLGEVGDSAKLLTYLQVREDILQLFGFSASTEKWMFMNLISVSGIGPKLAVSILSGCEVEEFRRLVVSENLAYLTKLPGIGRKTAQRLVMELKDKMEGVRFDSDDSTVVTAEPEIEGKYEEAVLALVALGHTRGVAEKVVTPIFKNESALALDEIIKRSLQSM